MSHFMCGRFAFIPNYDKLRAQFHLDEMREMAPRYNISPGSEILVLCSLDGLQINALQLRWGLIPFWAKDKKNVGTLNNARSETIFEKPAFKHGLKRRRGIVVMSGFYEWRAEQGIKQPFYITHKQGEYLAVAAIWDTCQIQSEVIHSCCLVTTDANKLMAPIHDRMPVILSSDDQQVWLNTEEYHPGLLINMMSPYTGHDLISFPVTREVNYSKFESHRAIIPLE